MNFNIIFTLTASFIILHIFYNKYQKLLYNVDDAEIAIRIRKEYSNIRYVIGILTGAIVIFIAFSVDFQIDVMTYLYLMIWIERLARIVLPISYKLLKDIPQEEKFVLYLRGFSLDNYEGVRTHLDRTHFKNFSEYHFINVFKKFFPVYSVGMTAELSTPNGATRIYLKDKEWKNDILYLIEKAEVVVILVNNSDNCIWEIEQCYDLDKTLLIVDDLEKMQTVREYFEKKHLYPFPISLASKTILYHIGSKGYTEITYINTESSYIKVIKQFMKDKYDTKRLIFPSWQVEMVVVLVFMLFSLTYFMTIFMFRICIPDRVALLCLILIFVLCAIIYALYSKPMSKWKQLKKTSPPTSPVNESNMKK